MPRLDGTDRISDEDEATNAGQHLTPVYDFADDVRVTVRANQIGHLLT